MATNQAIACAVPNECVDRDWLFWWLRSQREDLLAAGKGGTQSNISQTVLKAWPIPIAPRPEQARIVAAVEEAFSKLDAGEAGLRGVRQRLRRMRDAVLTAAITGRLVPQDATDTPAARLLADLGAQQASERLADLPSSWATVELSEVVSEPLANGRSVRSRAGGFPVLRLTCLREGRIDLAERKEGEWDAAAAAKFLVRQGDFLVSRGNGSLSLVGRGGLVDEEPDAVAYPDTLIRVRVPERVLEPSLLALMWNSQVVRQQLESQARTTAGIYKVNQGMLSAVRLPLPPREEQNRIVAEVERQMSCIDECERSIVAGLQVSAAMRRSVLRAAFEGRLVPQDPTDEPASVLLERIRADRAADPKPKKRRTRATA
jgi:type I restriction enzyme S subunit